MLQQQDSQPKYKVRKLFSHPYFSIKNQSIFLKIYVKTRSPKEKIVVEKDKVVVFVKKPPDKGKANKEIISFLSKELNCSSNDIEIVSGMKSHFKTLKIDNKSEEEIIKFLERFKE